MILQLNHNSISFLIKCLNHYQTSLKLNGLENNISKDHLNIKKKLKNSAHSNLAVSISAPKREIKYLRKITFQYFIEQLKLDVNVKEYELIVYNYSLLGRFTFDNNDQINEIIQTIEKDFV